MGDLIAPGLLNSLQAGHPLDRAAALALADARDTAALMALAAPLRDRGFRDVVTYSRKVFLPLTKLCRDVCHYCTFASTPREVGSAYMSLDEVLDAARQAAAMGCKEALLTLGERPELRYQAARDALAQMGFATTLEYVAHVAGEIFKQTGLLPHVNPGCMDAAELAMLRKVSPSMGLMLESASPRLCEKGMPHYGSPDKEPGRRLETLRLAGEARAPFTSGILIGIGETRRERIESLLALRDLHERYGHIQEIIVQNFRAKADTLMANAPEPSLDDLLWTIAVTRLIFGADMSIQAPPNLNPGVLPQLIAAGINDWGGVSPLTPDFVNPEAPWPHLDQLARETAAAGKYLQERLTIYPEYALDGVKWVDESLRTPLLQRIDGEGLPRTDEWVAGQGKPLPAEDLRWLRTPVDAELIAPDLRTIVARAAAGEELGEAEIVRLFQARGPEFAYVCRAADYLRQKVNGDVVSFVVTRNINYTNVCYFKCQFCAFSKGKMSENLRGQPYDLDETEIARRCREAWARGATEVCMQGGIHPDYTGQTYLDILDIVRGAAPDVHIHAYSPLEVWQGALTLEQPVEDYLRLLKARGLNTLPGTAAEVLDDEVRAVLCPDKINTRQWMQVIETAHVVGLKTTATIMFGHVDRYKHWARHLRRVRDIQVGTHGFTEFVPLPFVPMEAPLYLKGRARMGPTFREVMLMHAVARLALHGQIDNIQASWVKLGDDGVTAALAVGCNDLGGTLMNETITRSAGASHGEGKSPQELEQLIQRVGRQPRQRSTDYGEVSAERQQAARVAAELAPVVNTVVSGKAAGGARRKLVRFAIEDQRERH